MRLLDENRSPQILWASLIASTMAWLATPPSFADGNPLNIVLIMADDLGYGDLGCYGSTLNETPHVDALAKRGLRFTDFHASGPMCSPTRAATLTGQYQQRFGTRFDAALSGKTDYDHGLPHEAVTIAEWLKPQGYVSGCFGKWHLGYHPPWLPVDQGFDEFRGLASGDGDFHSQIDRLGREDWWSQNDRKPEVGYTTELVTAHSVDFINRHHDRPFFLYVPHLAIHFPWQGPNDPPHRVKGQNYLKDKFGVIPDRANVHPHVKAMIGALDESVGRIVSALARWKIQDRTLVIFTSDNGGYVSYAGGFKNISSNGPLRGQKTELYEGGHRVPMIVAWPGKIDVGVTHQTAHSIDLLATVAALTDTSIDEDQMDGVDLSPLLLRGESLPLRTLFWRTPNAMAVRRGPWKLFRQGRRTELYHLGNDLGEHVDLSATEPERTERLRKAWSAWESSVNSVATKQRRQK